MGRLEVNGSPGKPIKGRGWATGNGSGENAQRHVVLEIAGDEISICTYGDDETRQLMKALASASGGLLATLPDEPGPLDERDESALAAVQGDHVGEGVAE